MKEALYLREVKVWWVIGTEYYFSIVGFLITYLTESIYIILFRCWLKTQIPFSFENHKIGYVHVCVECPVKMRLKVMGYITCYM